MKMTIMAIASAGVLAVSLAGCTSSEIPAVLETNVPSSSAPAVEDASIGAITNPQDVVLPSGSNALGVITASLLIATGDISKAVAEGQVTPSEVKYAVLAIQEDTLEEWKLRAEAEQTQ